MSDSDDETAFASADEGEETTKASGKKLASGHGASAKKDGKGTATDAMLAAGSSPSAESTSTDQDKPDKKGKGKNRRQAKSRQGASSLGSPTEKKSGSDQGAKGDSVEAGKKQVSRKGQGNMKTADARSSLKSASKHESGNEEEKSAKANAGNKKTSVEDLSVKPEEKKQTSKDGKGEDDVKDHGGTGQAGEGSVEREEVPGARTDGAGTASGTEADQPAGTVLSPPSQSIPRSSAERPAAAEALNKLTEEDSHQQSSGWGWGSWGSSLLNVASSSVSTFKHQVGEGFHTILETVETTLGVPDPQELARAEMATEPGDGDNGATGHHAEEEPEEEGREERKQDGKKEEAGQQMEKEAAPSSASGENLDQMKTTSTESSSESSDNWFSSWGVSNLTSKLQQKGRTLVTGGSTLVGGTLELAESLAAGSLDALETLGKKTYSVLTEHDPRLTRTRALISRQGEKPNLSAMLREARDEAELRAQEDLEFEEARKAHFGALFDEFQGLAHLEALEILSSQSEKKVQALLTSASEEVVAAVKPELLGIKDVFEKSQEEQEEEVEEEHDFARLVTEHLTELHLGTSPDKLNSVQEKNRKWITNFYSEEEEGKTTEPKEIHRVAISALAELTARAVEQFHKAGELILLQRDADTTILARTQSLASLTQVLSNEIEIRANKFCQCLNKVGENMENDDDINPLVTNTYLEASNSSAYIQDAFQLLMPVLQQAALERSL